MWFWLSFCWIRLTIIFCTQFSTWQRMLSLVSGMCITSGALSNIFSTPNYPDISNQKVLVRFGIKSPAVVCRFRGGVKIGIYYSAHQGAIIPLIQVHLTALWIILLIRWISKLWRKLLPLHCVKCIVACCW